MFQPTREQARDFWFDAWRKYRAQEPLSALESMAVEIVVHHPEYQDMLGSRETYLERHRDRDYPPEFGETNPFLHMGMHLRSANRYPSTSRPACAKPTRSCRSKCNRRWRQNTR